VALDCAQEAAGQLRFEIEAAFSQGLPNTPMANATVRVVSGNFLTASRWASSTAWTSCTAVCVRKVDGMGIQKRIDTGALVLLSPFGFSPTGEAFNLTMEDVATEHAIALQADKLIFLTECRGHPRATGRSRQRHRHRTGAGRRQAPAGAVAEPAHCPPTAFYLQHCVKACAAAWSARTSCPLRWTARCCMEVFTHDGIGTMVVDEKLESLREATSDDVGGILQLIEPFERDGTLVKRDRTEIERDIANYTVIEHDGVIFGCAALYPYPKHARPKWRR
jgi:amino-acid N-acetyltransferase